MDNLREVGSFRSLATGDSRSTMPITSRSDPEPGDVGLPRAPCSDAGLAFRIHTLSST
ncbi:hypothetical protein SERLA73DRAFT_175516 [Serpula lacrymans var. lacrymans S7.3]|uniref:Uncharacterized protein n=2 Tax=Serpula lacrymans var. lacrymans TaxID=341189 RepID=F8PKC5_SERL3|nr:uncharacterized protein SERLADRAFT_458005 [Serpula lacrymans var. lacrymans S7.9]EGO03839.1 hypothetical protein SERLA73DRAFT_175516 [Serpula lacrymans var. lacrymans S7.3]EGO29763.1 hypothetical protein SERLADRAFT_458005 [Serpula lacrymans var. lacrymans S7.9]